MQKPYVRTLLLFFRIQNSPDFQNSHVLRALWVAKNEKVFPCPRGPWVVLTRNTGGDTGKQPLEEKPCWDKEGQSAEAMLVWSLTASPELPGHCRPFWESFWAQISTEAIHRDAGHAAKIFLRQSQMPLGPMHVPYVSPSMP